MAQLIFAILSLWASGMIAALLIGGGLTLLVGVGLNAAIEGLLNSASAYVGGATSGVFNLLMMGGVGEALSILGGAIITKAMINMAGRILGVAINAGTTQ